MTQSKFTVSAAAVITNDEGQVLLLDHLIRPKSGWGLPGGFLDRSEQPDDAVRREIREETGLELYNLKMLRVRTVGTHVEIIFRARSNDTPEVKSREIKGFGWFEPSKLPERMSLAQKRLIESVLSHEFEKKEAAD